MRKLILFTIPLLWGILSASAQVSNPRTYKQSLASADSYGEGRVTIDEPADLEPMLNRSNAGDRTPVKVYRVQIFLDNSQNARARANETSSRFKSLFPDISAHVGHKDPYFNVIVGDYYLSKEDAVIVLGRIRDYFRDVFIIQTDVPMYELIANYANPGATAPPGN